MNLLQEMSLTEQQSTLTTEAAFEAFRKRRHWELYKKQLINDLVKRKS